MRVSYTAGYWISLPEGHAFPMAKYPLLYQRLNDEGLITEARSPAPVSPEHLALVHTPEYLDQAERGILDRAAERRLGLPWSPALFLRARLAVQGTLDAARLALEDGIAANLAGGTHHAFADHGEGFCVFNDVAVALRVLAREGTLGRALVLDLDVHQGNGTAAIFAGDPAVYTFSVHGERNYPFHKEQSRRDVGLPDGIGDHSYLETLERHLDEVLAEARPDLVCYLAGVDVVAGDRYGRLALSRAGLEAREGLVLSKVKAAGAPLVLVLAGGYAASPEATADLHAVVHRQARRVFG
ncbi:MAG: histone deacetylase [Candidatus Latescibacteria bacterium]|nr:histone deacetylase [Candidatus Latescibacterota bacterium]